MSLSLLSPGYYYDMDESYDESDEEEVKAHLRRVMEQPPLKLDTSSEVLEHGPYYLERFCPLSFWGFLISVFVQTAGLSSS